MNPATLYRTYFSKRISVFILFTSGLFLVSCKKDSASCHYTLKINNRSYANVTYATVGTYDSQCFVTTKSVIRPGEIHEDKRNDCWEQIIKENDFEFQIQKMSTNPLGTSVMCDSSSSDQNVLKKYHLTESDLPFLQKDNFVVNFIEL